jgi:hypothetical protein
MTYIFNSLSAFFADVHLKAEMCVGAAKSINARNGRSARLSDTPRSLNLLHESYAYEAVVSTAEDTFLRVGPDHTIKLTDIDKALNILAQVVRDTDGYTRTGFHEKPTWFPDALRMLSAHKVQEDL